MSSHPWLYPWSAFELDDPILVSFCVEGEPRPKGSSKAIVSKTTGRAILIHDNRPKLKAWARAVADRARLAMAANPPFDCPLAIQLEFHLPRPASVPIRKRPLPDRKPDLDKLVRAVGDALTGIVYVDDARVCVWTAGKRYAPTGEFPGVYVIVRMAEEPDEAD